MNSEFQLPEFPVSSIQSWWFQRSVSDGCHLSWLLSRKHDVSNLVKRIYTCLVQAQKTFSQEMLQVMKLWPSSWSRDQTRSMQWKHNGSPTPKKFLVQQSDGKIMATVFWDSEGVLLLEFMPHKTNITETPILPQWWLYERIRNRNAVESCRLVSCCFMTMYPHTSLAYRGLLQGIVASWSLTMHPTVQIWLPVITFLQKP